MDGGLPKVASEKGPRKVSKFAPHNAAYWTSDEVACDRALLTPRFKTLRASKKLTATIDADVEEKAAYDKLRYVM